jgi:hypothetical protein
MQGAVSEKEKARGLGVVYNICKVYNGAQPPRTIIQLKKKKKKKKIPGACDVGKRVNDF